MTHKLETTTVAQYLLTQERFFTKAELSQAKKLMKWLDYSTKMFKSTQYLDFLRSQNLKTHKISAQFALEVFVACGDVYE